jgi:hypothetical protein
VLGDPVEDLTLAQAADEERLDARGDLAVGVERAGAGDAAHDGVARRDPVQPDLRAVALGDRGRAAQMPRRGERDDDALGSRRPLGEEGPEPWSSSPTSGSMIVTVPSRA